MSCRAAVSAEMHSSLFPSEKTILGDKSVGTTGKLIQAARHFPCKIINLEEALSVVCHKQFIIREGKT